MKYFTSPKKHFYNSLWIASFAVFVLVFVFVFERMFRIDLSFLGVSPRSLSKSYGIITHVLVHANVSHLINNSISLFVLTLALFYFYEKIADVVFLLLWFFTGLLLWLIGRESYHVGASGLIYALAAFLFVGGVIRRYIPLLAVSLLVVVLFGNMVWHIFPWQPNDPVSWEGHLSGSIVGTIVALFFYKHGPQRPVKDWHEEQDTDEDKDLAEYAESFDLEGEESKPPLNEKSDNLPQNENNGFVSSEKY